MSGRITAAIASLFILCASPALLANPKIDPFLDDMVVSSEAKALSISVPFPPVEEDPSVEVFIRANSVDAARRAIESAGGTVRVVSGNVMTAFLPASGIDDVALEKGVDFIEAGKPVGRSVDLAGSEIGLPEVSQGTLLPETFTGRGIIVGLIDTGIDFSHPDFLDSNGNSRVLGIWDQSRSGGTPPEEIESGYGVECDALSIASGSCALVDVDGHGTHVAGIAAGADEKYRGVAPEANIIMVKYSAELSLDSGYADPIFSTKICDAAYYIFAKAMKYGMPAVINLSLGTHLGPHDGSSLFEQCLGGLLQDQAGRAMVAAAGNEYSGDRDYTGVHAGFDPEGKIGATNFVIRQKTGDRTYYIDLWGDVGAELSVGLALHSGLPSGSPVQKSYMARMGDKIIGNFDGGKIGYVINATETDSPLNGKPHVGIRIVLSSAVENPLAYSFDLIVEGRGSFDAWLFPDKPARTIQFTSVSGDKGGNYGYIPGDRVKSIAVPATSPDIIAVGGYATRTRWEADSLTWVFNGQELGEILNFSSSGPSVNPEAAGQKPELTAPGGMIASSLSASSGVSTQVITPDGEHYMQAGTSMAAPFVAGAIALMFEHDPDFTQSDVEGFLVQSAYSDSFTGAVPNDRWGAGKLDLLKAMELAINGEASGSFSAQGSLTVPNEDSSGQGGCSMVAPVGAPDGLAPLCCALLSLAALALIRRNGRGQY